MPPTYSHMALHFRYRLWIAEMNADISVLRIFNDYIVELSSKNGDPAVKSGIAEFNKVFTGFRGDIDELRHEMHLCKMSLAADAKASGKSGKTSSITGDHSALEKRYTGYRKKFDTVKQEFGSFEGKWL